jgi:hypothetical protein
MKQTVCYAIMLFILSFQLVCNDQATGPEYMQNIVGTWVHQTDQDTVTIMQRASGLDSNKYGFIFNSDGTFVERKNSGWCGTPPINYANFSGQWKQVSRNEISINVGYWGGQTSYCLRVLSLNDTDLRMVITYNSEL